MKRAPRSAPAPVSAPSAPSPAGWPLAAVFPLLLGVTLLAYGPCLTGTFLWDDEGHVTSPALQSLEGLRRIWFEPGATQQYYPLLHTAFWLEHRLWGDATLGYHVANVLWHATSACLFIALLRRLGLAGAGLAGAVFALHPVAVESVAWISEQKNTLSTVFYLAAALAWVRFDDHRRPADYAAASVWFAAALLTKTVTATLPGALLVVAWWRRGRISWSRDVGPLLPWMIFGTVAGLGTAWFERSLIGAQGGDFALGAVERALLAGRVAWFYFGQVLWPSNLTFFHPRWVIDASVGWQWLFPLAAVAVLAGFHGLRHRTRAPLAAALLFGGTLFPVLGFMNVYPFVFSYVADHFQYLANLGLIAFLTAAAVDGYRRLTWPRWIGRAAAGVLLLGLGVLTWRQSGMYRDPFTLYETTLARNPESWVARLNYGTLLADHGRRHEALPHLRRSLELKPDHPETLNTLGNVLNQLGRPLEALPLLDAALVRQPRFAAAHNTRGAVLMTLGRADEGIAAFRQALTLNPGLTLARVNLGWGLANLGRAPEGLTELDRALREQPESPDVRFKTGLVHAMLRRLPEAETHLRRAVELQPDQAEYHHVLALLLLDLGRVPSAAEHFEAALRLAPDHPGALQGLAEARRRLGH